MDGDIEDEIKRRIQLGWAAFGKHREIFKGDIPLCLKRKMFDECILPVITYGAETWALTEILEEKLRVAQRRMERAMLGITIKDRRRNEWIRSQTKVKDVVQYIKCSKWQWAGHIARDAALKWSVTITEWTPLDDKRGRGRPKVRWEDEIRRAEGVLWRRAARDRSLWKKRGRPSSSSGLKMAEEEEEYLGLADGPLD